MTALQPDLPQDLFGKFKEWYKSRTFWGLIMMIVPVILSILGANFTITDIETDATEMIDKINLTWNNVVEFVGFVLAWWGRVKAKYKINPPWKTNPNPVE